MCVCVRKGETDRQTERRNREAKIERNRVQRDRNRETET